MNPKKYTQPFAPGSLTATKLSSYTALPSLQHKNEEDKQLTE